MHTTTRRILHLCRSATIGAAFCLLFAGAGSAEQSGDPASSGSASPPATLEEARLKMGKWIETQQIISKERNEWQQGKDILTSRLELVQREISSLEERIKQAETSVAETSAKRDAIAADNDRLKAGSGQLATVVTGMEAEVRRIYSSLPEPIQTKLQPLRQRIPEDPANTKVTVAERFQNVLGILNELNKADNAITVNYEVRELANGKSSEVRALYVGLTQAYYVSAGGDAGIGRPTPEGWKWKPSKELASDVMTALEILQGKHSPAFVPLPVELQ